MVSYKWLYTLACIPMAFAKPCEDGYTDELRPYLDKFVSEEGCWQIEELPVSGDFIGHSKREDTSQPPSCSYNSDWANLLCNNQPHPWVYWTAGGLALAGTAAWNIPNLLNRVTTTIEAARRLQVTWRTAGGDIEMQRLKREEGETLVEFKVKPTSYNTMQSDNVVHSKRYEHNRIDDIITLKGHHISIPSVAKTRRGDALDGGKAVLDVSTGILSWNGGLEYDCLYQEVEAVLGPVIRGETNTFGCAQIYWGADDGMSRIPIQWSLWTQQNEEGSHQYHHLWGDCCGATPQGGWEDIDY